MTQYEKGKTVSLLAHVDVESAASHDVLVVQDEGSFFAALGLVEGFTLQGLAIELGFFDVEGFLAEAVRADGEGLAAADVEGGFLHEW